MSHPEVQRGAKTAKQVIDQMMLYLGGHTGRCHKQDFVSYVRPQTAFVMGVWRTF